VSVADLPAAGRWPRFTAAAAEVGFAAVHALSMRLRTEVIGALNFFDTSPGALDVGKLRIGQALADVATIGRHGHAQGFRLIRDGFVDLDSWAARPHARTATGGPATPSRSPSWPPSAPACSSCSNVEDGSGR
jgi:hypothetical protein